MAETNIMSKLMTKEEQSTLEWLVDVLGQQGYATYAKLLSKFALHLTEDMSTIAYMIPDKGIIVINRYVSSNQVSVLVRHEILHQFLEHGKREVAKLGDKAKNMSIHELSNMAADYEISNRGYTEQDKRTVRHIEFNNDIVSGLVTEDKDPSWVNLTYEEMLDKLMQEKPQNSSQMESAIKIGAMGNSAQQEAEDVKRSAQIKQEQNQSQSQQGQGQDQKQDQNKSSSGDDTNGDDTNSNANKQLDKASQQAGQLAKQINDSNKSSAPNSVFPNYDLSPEEIKEIEANLAEIKKAIDDITTQKQIDDETNKIKNKANDAEKQKQQDKEHQKYVNNPLNRFVTSLDGFIARQISYGRDSTWKRFNPTYVNNQIIRPGKTSSAESHIPLINVYYDRSGSWDDPAKQAIGQRGIATLNKYERDGKIKVNFYYFAERVSTKDDSSVGSGTNGQPILDNIKKTKPDNVIIITDGDISDCADNITVPGAVWFLFVENESIDLINHLKGKQLTMKYNIFDY